MDGVTPHVDLTWFVARVGPFAEFKIADELMALGLDAYAPWETVWCANPRRTWLGKVRKFPLIPRYIFVKLDLERPRTDIVEGISGVKMLRTATGKPCLVHGAALDQIRWHQIRGLYDHTTGNNASAKRKAKRALHDAVREAQVGQLNPRGAKAVTAVKIPEATGRTHPFGPTYRVVSR